MDATVFTPNTEPIAIFKNLAVIVLLGVVMYFAYGWIKKGSSGGGRKVKPVAKM